MIARELHDSLAQALSYMKIQASLLQPLLGEPARAAEAARVLTDLREGISAAYRQLRELLVSFRLELSGDFPSLLREAVQEHAARGGVTVKLSTRLADCALSPNQEVHVLQIVREGRESGEFERKTPLDETAHAIYLVMKPYLDPLQLQHNLNFVEVAPPQLSNLILRSLAP